MIPNNLTLDSLLQPAGVSVFHNEELLKTTLRIKLANMDSTHNRNIK